MAFGKDGLVKFNENKDSVFLLKSESGESVEQFMVPETEESEFVQKIQSSMDQLEQKHNKGKLTLIRVSKII